VAALLIVAGYSFIYQNPYFAISEKDVEVKLPPGFPKPVYDFSKNKPSPAAFLLGRRLFYDGQLSKDNTVSCGTCHQRIAAFAHIDHALSHGIYARIGTRNVPALQNLIWKDAYMWDGREKSLELQPLHPITSPIEMDENLPGIIAKLQRDPGYTAMFRRAFGDSAITQERILKSLAQFTGLMISVSSRYDGYLKNVDTFSLAEKKGLALFRQKCAGCHKEPLFTDNSYRSNGIAPDTSLKDKGRGAITLSNKDNYAFKVPGLRNIEMTYPYMHDGRMRNLQQAVAHYASPENFQTDSDPLLKRIGVLNIEEQKQIVAFLKTLTDKTFLYDRRFADPALEQAFNQNQQ
jgi:cytochrome c peroxidase